MLVFLFYQLGVTEVPQYKSVHPRIQNIVIATNNTNTFSLIVLCATQPGNIYHLITVDRYIYTSGPEVLIVTHFHHFGSPRAAWLCSG